MYLFPNVEFLTYIPKVSPMSRVRPLNSQLKMLICAALGWELDTLNPFWSIKGPKGSIVTLHGSRITLHGPIITFHDPIFKLHGPLSHSTVLYSHYTDP